MPYMGVVVQDGNNKITIKLHGSFDNYPVNPVELRDCAKAILMNNGVSNVPSKVHNLADKLATIFVDNEKIMYVVIEHETTSNNNIYGASADWTVKDE